MKLSEESTYKLINYIRQNSVVYQVYGELIEVADEMHSEEKFALLEYLNKTSSIEFYKKGDSFIHEPFEELDNWATEQDALFLLEVVGVLVCIPYKDISEIFDMSNENNR